MEEARIHYLCVEYKNPHLKQYGKCYISFDLEGNLNYDQLVLYSLEELEQMLKKYSQQTILNHVKKDNLFYYLAENIDEKYLFLSIRYHQNGKERSISPLTKECLNFDIKNFFQKELNKWSEKIIYNLLGGYLTNIHISDQMKQWIKKIRQESGENLALEFEKLPYSDQRIIREVIYTYCQNLEAKTALLEQKRLVRKKKESDEIE